MWKAATEANGDVIAPTEKRQKKSFGGFALFFFSRLFGTAGMLVGCHDSLLTQILHLMLDFSTTKKKKRCNPAFTQKRRCASAELRALPPVGSNEAASISHGRVQSVKLSALWVRLNISPTSSLPVLG